MRNKYDFFLFHVLLYRLGSSSKHVGMVNVRILPCLAINLEVNKFNILHLSVTRAVGFKQLCLQFARTFVLSGCRNHQTLSFYLLRRLFFLLLLMFLVCKQSKSHRLIFRHETNIAFLAYILPEYDKISVLPF